MHLTFVLCCRVNALFFTDRICCEPLTEWIHFADLWDGQPAYMEYLVRIMYGLGVLCEDLCKQLSPYADAEAAEPSAAPHRIKQLADSIPYMIRDER